MYFVVPMFQGVYARLGTDLPHITKIIISASNFTSKYIGVFIFIINGFSQVYAFDRKFTPHYDL